MMKMSTFVIISYDETFTCNIFYFISSGSHGAGRADYAAEI